MTRDYAEEFAYWYQRLNGFFPITDFVLHVLEGYTNTLALRASFTGELVHELKLAFLEKVPSCLA